jgi:hypothetical protein
MPLQLRNIARNADWRIRQSCYHNSSGLQVADAPKPHFGDGVYNPYLIKAGCKYSSHPKV